MIKQALATVVYLVALSCTAGDLTVPAIDSSLWFSEEAELTDKDGEALSESKNWINDKQYPFREGNKVVYLYEGGLASLVCAPLKLCLIELESGERIVENGVQLGDQARWKITPTVGANQSTFVVVKPVDVGLETSLALVTDRRVYYIRLISRAADYMPIVAFEYQSEIDAKWQAYYAKSNQKKQLQSEVEQRETIPNTQSNISDLDFNYKLTGCEKCLWRPLRVFNDGQQTFIQMSNATQQGDSPVLLVISNEGESLVNYRVVDNQYIVDMIFDEAILLAGVGKKQSRLTIKRVSE